QHRAMADSGKTNAAALTEQEKAMATYAIILDQTKSAQGDYARTATGMANSQRTATAEWENAQAALGQKLLPMMTQIVQVLTAMASWAAQNTTLVLIITAVVGALATFVIVVRSIIALTETWTAVQIALDVAMDANPIGLVVLAIEALIGVIVLIAIKTTWFQQLWGVMWG